jgi:hypothetical protein
MEMTMKYLVSTRATLRFTDGKAVELTPGIHRFPKEVVDHWAFKAHAQPVDDEGPVAADPTEALIAKVGELEAKIGSLQEQVAGKDSEIGSLQEQVKVLQEAVDAGNKPAPPALGHDPVAQKETGNAKKQSSSDK